MISKYNEDNCEADEDLEEMSKDKYARALYEAREKEARDILTRLNEAREEGIEEGRALGIEEGRALGRALGRAQAIAENIAEGIAEGIIEGKAEAELRIAQKLREYGLSDEMIKLTTGVDLPPLE